MARKKQLEGVELANEFLLKSLCDFLVSKKFYDKNKVVNEVMSRKDVILKTGKIYKMLKKAGLETRYDIVFKFDDNAAMIFGNYGPMIISFRKEVIKKSFAHRTDINN